jgi:hypothetical protein
MATMRRIWAGKPFLIGQVNTAFGPESTVDEARSAVMDYYSFTGDFAVQTANGLLTSAEDILGTIAHFEDLGADEVVLACWSPDIDQGERLAQLVG